MFKLTILLALIAFVSGDPAISSKEGSLRPYKISKRSNEVDITAVLTDMISSIMELEDYYYEAKNERQRRDINDNNIDSEVVENADQKPSPVSTAMTYLKGVPLVLYETTTIVAPITMQYMFSEERPHPHCELKMMCEVNTRLTARYGRPGELVMQLASTLAGYAIGGDNAPRYDALLEASRMGRRNEDCSEKFPKCSTRADSSPIPVLIRMASRIMNN
ncbi:uncharacterized protein LOC136030042 [Artemia franciscana]|uniref:uncharacterized protein LOC136030042 n=1 Tax=Artemia franciscana TaxID=6661 RepID=UPI0032DBA060